LSGFAESGRSKLFANARAWNPFSGIGVVAAKRNMERSCNGALGLTRIWAFVFRAVTEPRSPRRRGISLSD
jgi:hypothetical protein